MSPRWNFTVGDMQLMLVEGEEGAEGHSCGLFEELQWELGVDTVSGLVYRINRLGFLHSLTGTNRSGTL